MLRYVDSHFAVVVDRGGGFVCVFHVVFLVRKFVAVAVRTTGGPGPRGTGKLKPRGPDRKSRKENCAG